MHSIYKIQFDLAPLFLSTLTIIPTNIHSRTE